MIAESALSLLNPEALPALAQKGGVLTPMTAFGDVLVERLRETGRFEFESGVVEEGEGEGRKDVWGEEEFRASGPYENCKGNGVSIVGFIYYLYHGKSAENIIDIELAFTFQINTGQREWLSPLCAHLVGGIHSVWFHGHQIYLPRQSLTCRSTKTDVNFCGLWLQRQLYSLEKGQLPLQGLKPDWNGSDLTSANHWDYRGG